MISSTIRRYALGCFAALAVAGISLTPAATSAAIAIHPTNRSYVESFATNDSGSNSRIQEDVVSLPSSGSPSAADGGLTSETHYTLSDAGFSFTMDQRGLAISDATAQTNVSIYLTPDVDTAYDINGSYRLIAGGAPIVNLRLAIRVGTSSDFAYRGNHSSRGIVGETHTLGESSGNIFDTEEGSLTGTLLAGQMYHLTLQTRILSNLSAQAAGTGSGYVNIAFVPEPSTALLLGLGLTGLSTRWRGRTAG